MRDPENHPIKVGPQGVSDQERIKWLEQCVAQLWDQVWWMRLERLDPVRYYDYKQQGHSDPIPQFYGIPDVIETVNGRSSSLRDE